MVAYFLIGMVAWRIFVVVIAGLGSTLGAEEEVPGVTTVSPDDCDGIFDGIGCAFDFTDSLFGLFITGFVPDVHWTFNAFIAAVQVIVVGTWVADWIRGRNSEE